MKLPLELRLVIRAIEPEGVIIQPEYWWGSQLIDTLPERKLQAGEALLYGPHETDVHFHPPIVLLGQSGN